MRWMKAMKNRIQKSDSGSAMIVAIVVSMVLIIFSLSLLLVAYSLFASTAKGDAGFAAKELAKSISKELEQELTVHYNNYAEQEAAAVSGENQTWFYLRYNLWQQNGWAYYNEDELQMLHGKDAAYRYYSIEPQDGTTYAGIAEDIRVTMYWECSENLWDAEIKEDTPLHVRVTVEKSGETYSVESTYVLDVGEYGEVPAGQTVGYVSQAVNPRSNNIEKRERWIWVKEE